jgi:predicted membrane protein
MYDEERWQRKRERWERKMNRHWDRRMRYRQHSPGRHLFSGFLFVLIGGLFLLGNMGLLDVDRILRFWPVILIALGLFKLVESGDDYGNSSGIFWVVVGGLFLLGNLGILRVAFRDLWPVVFIGLGVLILWRSALIKGPPKNLAPPPPPGVPPPPSFGSKNFTDERTADPGTAGRATENDARPGTGSSNSVLSAMAILGNVERRNNSQDFRGGSATSVMGRCEIDLRAAAISSGNEPVLEVFAMWGGIEIRVPPDWTVVSHVDPIMGGYEDHTQPPKEESKRFLIRGAVIMGGIEVTN